MTAIALERAAGHDEGAVGRIRTDILIANDYDRERSEAGTLSAALARSVLVPNALVDTAATTLWLPPALVARLGLPLKEEVVVWSAGGEYLFRTFWGAHISLLGRSGTFVCSELLDGSELLLGRIPMEALGLEPDMQRHELRVLPEEHGATYLRA